jgi:hypothetical protein
MIFEFLNRKAIDENSIAIDFPPKHQSILILLILRNVPALLFSLDVYCFSLCFTMYLISLDFNFPQNENDSL